MSSGSGEALLGSTQTGAVRESGHGRGTPGGGTGRSSRGTFFSLCFDFSPCSCLIFPPLPPLPTLSDQHVSLLFIYMSNCINKYATCSSSLILLTVINVITVFFILNIRLNDNHCVKRHIDMLFFPVLIRQFPALSLSRPHIPILNHVLHSRGVQRAQLP